MQCPRLAFDRSRLQMLLPADEVPQIDHHKRPAHPPAGLVARPTPTNQRGRRGNDPGLEKPRKCPREDLNLHPVTWTRT